MKTLEEEADLYSVNTDVVHPADSYVAKHAFIAGANSKWVQAEKIKAQIECWEKALKIIPREDEDSILLLVKKLKQQLKQLEHESNTN